MKIGKSWMTIRKSRMTVRKNMMTTRKTLSRSGILQLLALGKAFCLIDSKLLLGSLLCSFP